MVQDLKVANSFLKQQSFNVQCFSNRFPTAAALLEKSILGEKIVAPGFVAGFYDLKSEQFYQSSFGFRRLALNGLQAEPMTVDTIFDLASVSKVFATTMLATVLMDRGWIEEQTRVCSLLDDYPFPDVTIAHLLSHSSGMIWWKPYYEEIRNHFGADSLVKVNLDKRVEVMRKLVYSTPLDREVGSSAIYSDLSFLVLGWCLEQVTQMRLDIAVRQFVWKPLGIRDSKGELPYYVLVNKTAEQARMDLKHPVAATEDCPWRGLIQGQVHDDNAWSMGGVAGHAGVFANIDHLHVFASQILKSSWIPRFSKKYCDTRTLGWDTPSGETPSFPAPWSSRSFGHTGFTGTSIWFDPDLQIAVILLSNRVHPTRENPRMKEFRGVFHRAVYQDWSRLHHEI